MLALQVTLVTRHLRRCRGLVPERGSGRTRLALLLPESGAHILWRSDTTSAVEMRHFSNDIDVVCQRPKCRCTGISAGGSGTAHLQALG